MGSAFFLQSALYNFSNSLSLISGWQIPLEIEFKIKHDFMRVTKKQAFVTIILKPVTF